MRVLQQQLARRRERVRRKSLQGRAEDYEPNGVGGGGGGVAVKCGGNTGGLRGVVAIAAIW